MTLSIYEPGCPWTVEDNRWVVLEMIAMFTPQRMMFGSNFPVDSLCRFAVRHTPGKETSGRGAN